MITFNNYLQINIIMKRIIFFLVVLLSLPAFGQSQEDTDAIRQAVLNYIEGWATGNIERIQESVSPELSKRKAGTSGEMVVIQDMSRSLLCASALANSKGVRMADRTPDQPLTPDLRSWISMVSMPALKRGMPNMDSLTISTCLRLEVSG